ncbi:MAG: hypothetical protein WCK91_03560 [bacterium]
MKALIGFVVLAVLCTVGMLAHEALLPEGGSADWAWVVLWSGIPIGILGAVVTAIVLGVKALGNAIAIHDEHEYDFTGDELAGRRA